jgi:hypothetical protein
MANHHIKFSVFLFHLFINLYDFTGESLPKIGNLLAQPRFSV